MKKTIIMSALSLISMSAFADTSIPDVKGQMKVTANVAAGCDLSAENINFGVLQMPLANQSANANITVVCSKGANVNIGISYSNASVNSNGNVTYKVHTTQAGAQWIALYNNGERISNQSYDLSCNSNYLNNVVIFNEKTANLLGMDWYSLSELVSGAHRMFADTMGICSSNYKAFNASKLTSYLSGFGIQEQGTLVGVNSSEKIIYSLEVPNNSSLKWSAQNIYEFVATGVEQNIAMKANIETTNNPTHRMTPDTYLSTLTVQLSY